MIPPVEVSVVLDSPPDAAFAAFSRDLDRWWPKVPFSICEGSLAMERRLGGRITERGPDGGEHVWGHVTGWQPPQAIEISWYVGRSEDSATVVRLTFTPTDDGRTGLTLVQSGWEALGTAAQETRGRYQAGWQEILGRGLAPFIAEVG